MGTGISVLFLYWSFGVDWLPLCKSSARFPHPPLPIDFALFNASPLGFIRGLPLVDTVCSLEVGQAIPMASFSVI